ncbi:9-O-acetylesterase [Haloferula helveola]|uniref:9-O-acetylesterase n=1 Tax=Haloferula helveola TaxID=490095 RepID=A0ABM7REH2_9BACT|nr:9-O-acetylesterase [Haloferula helveola]
MTHPYILTVTSALASVCMAVSPSRAEPAPTLEPVMPLPFQDNAVLQQNMELPVWGQSLPGAEVMVSFDGQSKTVTADAEGKWRALLDPMTAVPLKSVNDAPAGKILTVVCEKDGKQARKEIRNLLVGDVWLCAGQSNMAGRMKTGTSRHHPEDSIQKADYPALRLLGGEGWLVCSPETAPAFNKVAFFFARRLQQDALVPVGLMVTAVGGSKIESWLNQPPHPVGKHYQELLEPLVGYGIRGAIWYQGESNEKGGRDYHPKLKSLIEGWRKSWGQGSFPVHFVQLPGIRESGSDNPAGGDGRAEIRQAYVDTLAVEDTGMAVTIDVGTKGEHPPNKYDTGVRLARSVLNKVYGLESISACPLYKSHEVEGNTIRVSFSKNADNGLMIAKKAEALPDGFLPPVPTPDAKLQWLSIRDASGQWHWADGKIEGSELVVSADGVEKPDAVRYAYTTQPLGHLLYNIDGMPVGPFTTCGYDDAVEPPR